jgi:glycosyltransferase involved in cell wall biosynthesis
VRAPPGRISVIVPMLNAAATLPEQLEALADQRCEVPWELVAADNGSTDESRRVVEEWLAADGRAGHVVEAAARRGPGHARNVGVAHSTGDLLVFTDADDLVAPGWIQAMAEAAQRGDVVAGRLEVDSVNDPVVRSWFHGPPSDAPITAHGFLPFASSGNCAVWRDVFERVGGFAEVVRFGGDIDFSWRAQLAGHELVFARGAVLRRRYPPTVGAVARQHYRWGQANALLYRRHRAAGMRRAGARDAARTWSAILAAAPLAPWSRTRRGRWVRIAALHFGQAVGSVRYRVVFP